MVETDETIKSITLPDTLTVKELADELDLSAIEIIKELPITLILRPFNFETFATKAYSYAAQDLLEAAAFPSLCLVIWASLFILFVSRYILSDK